MRGLHPSRTAALLFLLGLNTCADPSYEAHKASKDLVGRTIAQVEQCAGKPSVTDTLSDGTTISQWDYTEPSGTTSIPIPIAALADVAALVITPFTMLASSGTATVGFANVGSCHVIMTVKDTIVTRVRYSGANGGLSGRDAVCAPVIRECLVP